MADNFKHESFSVQDVTSGARKKIVRQDRIAVAPKKFFIKHVATDLRWEILNVSSFGLAAIVTEENLAKLEQVFSGEQTIDCLIYTGNTEVQAVRLSKVRQHIHPESVFKDYIVGFESVGGTIAVESLQALEVADDIIAAATASIELGKQIPGPFKQVVFEMKEFLGQFRDKIDQVEQSLPQDSAAANSEFRDTITAGLSEYLNSTIPGLYAKIPALLKDFDSQTKTLCSDFLRLHLSAFVFGAPFAHRAFHKPRGYAGDYEMMNHVYRDELVGRSLFNQCMHRYFIDEPAAQAVKNRGKYLLEKIKDVVRNTDKKEINILAVASGPAMEQQLFLKESAAFQGKKVNFVCIDQDEESLKHAQRQMLSIERFVKSGHSFQFRNLAIKNILAKGLPSGDFDLIYSAGLFDYFTDPVAQMAATKLFGGLSPGGTLIIGNFSKDNPSQAQMELLLDWHLIYRSASEMTSLFAEVGHSVTIEKEPLGINLFAVIK